MVHSVAHPASRAHRVLQVHLVHRVPLVGQVVRPIEHQASEIEVVAHHQDVDRRHHRVPSYAEVHHHHLDFVAARALAEDTGDSTDPGPQALVART